MAVPQNTEVPTYVVYRDTKPGEPFDPTSPLLFFPPKGSDELFDALRIAFPNVKTHSERMRDAMIQYLLEERQDEQLASPAATMDTMPTTWPSMSDSNSTWSSPELLNFPTPGASFLNSPHLAPELTRQTSTATSSQPSPSGPSIDQMTNVFCLSTSNQPKQRVRRKMTDAEKAEYRKRRIVKACDKCAKRKRKCPHNQAEMANVPNKTTTARGSKSATKLATPPSDIQSQKMAVDSTMDFDSIASTFDPNEFIAFDDFNMFEDTYPELDINDMINWNQGDLFTPDVSPVQKDWSYGNQADDFTLLDPRVPNQLQLSDMSFSSGQTRGDTLYDQNDGGEQPQCQDLDSSAHFDDVQALAKAGGLTRQGNGQYTKINTGDASGGSGNRMLWEHLRTGQPEPQPEKPVPTHTAHVHDAESGGLSGLDELITQPVEVCRQQTLPQTVMRLAATAKAVRSFTRLLGDRSQTSSTPILQRIVDALRDRDLLTEDHLQRQDVRGTNSVPAHLQRSRFQTPTLKDVEKQASAQPDEANLANPGVLRHIKQPGSRTNVLFLLGEPSAPLTSTSVLVSRRSLRRSAATSQGWPQQQQTSAEHGGVQSPLRPTVPGRQQPSLGEGIPADASAASDLYRARRRISPALNRYTNVNTSANANAGIPGTDELSVNPSAAPTINSGSRILSSRIKNAISAAADVARSTPTPQPNGGAYLRVEAQNAVIHTRSRNPTASGFSGDTHQYHGGAGSASFTTTVATTTSTAQAVATGLQSHAERLLDHNRFRDHHGRSIFLAVVAMIGIFMLASASITTATPTLALLAFLSIQNEHNVDRTHVRCSTKNSSWLSTFASMQIGSLLSSFKGKGKGKEHGDTVWLKALREPSLLQLAVVGA